MDACVRDSDGLILQLGTGLPADPTWSIVTLTDAQIADFQAKLATSGGAGVTLANGVLTANPAPPPPPPPMDPLASYKQALETAFEADISSGHPSQATLTALQNLLTAMAPHAQ